MSFFVDASQEEAFRVVTNYFTGRNMKISNSSPPSYIEAEFGSLISLTLDNSRGKAKLKVAKSNGGSYANLNLDFSLEYLAALVLTIIGALITYIYYTIQEFPLGYTLFIILLIFILIWGLVGYSVTLTRRKIIEEFNMFIQSLASKKNS